MADVVDNKHAMSLDYGGIKLDWDDDRLIVTACGIDWNEVDDSADLWDIMELVLCNTDWEMTTNAQFPLGLTSDERIYLVEWMNLRDDGSVSCFGRVYTYMESDIRSEVSVLREHNRLVMRRV